MQSLLYYTMISKGALLKLHHHHHHHHYYNKQMANTSQSAFRGGGVSPLTLSDKGT